MGKIDTYCVRISQKNFQKIWKELKKEIKKHPRLKAFGLKKEGMVAMLIDHYASPSHKLYLKWSDNVQKEKLFISFLHYEIDTRELILNYFPSKNLFSTFFWHFFMIFIDFHIIFLTGFDESSDCILGVKLILWSLDQVWGTRYIQ